MFKKNEVGQLKFIEFLSKPFNLSINLIAAETLMPTPHVVFQSHPLSISILHVPTGAIT